MKKYFNWLLVCILVMPAYSVFAKTYTIDIEIENRTDRNYFILDRDITRHNITLIDSGLGGVGFEKECNDVCYLIKSGKSIRLEAKIQHQWVEFECELDLSKDKYCQSSIGSDMKNGSLLELKLKHKNLATNNVRADLYLATAAGGVLKGYQVWNGHGWRWFRKSITDELEYSWWRGYEKAKFIIDDKAKAGKDTHCHGATAPRKESEPVPVYLACEL